MYARMRKNLTIKPMILSRLLLVYANWRVLHFRYVCMYACVCVREARLHLVLDGSSRE